MALGCAYAAWACARLGHQLEQGSASTVSPARVPCLAHINSPATFRAGTGADNIRALC